MAFTREEELDLKYNVKTSNALPSDKKRNIEEISKKKTNPFAKQQQSMEVNSSAFESAVDHSIHTEKEIDQEEINRVT